MFTARSLASRLPLRVTSSNSRGLSGLSCLQKINGISRQQAEPILRFTPTLVHPKYMHTEKQAIGQSTSIPSITETSTTTALTPPPSWLDKLPTSLRWSRPYFELSRLDKPIGSWLLYWPCGEPTSSKESFSIVDISIHSSLVDYYGGIFVRLSAPVYALSARSFRNWSSSNAWSRLYHQ